MDARRFGTRQRVKTYGIDPMRPTSRRATPRTRVNTEPNQAATAAVRSGHVRVNGEPVKAAHKVRVGDEVRLRVEGFDRILGVVLPLNKRVSYPQARMAYDDRTAERPRVHIPIAVREKGSGRPTKKERRELDRLRGYDSHEHH